MYNKVKRGRKCQYKISKMLCKLENKNNLTVLNPRLYFKYIRVSKRTFLFMQKSLAININY